MTLSEFERRDTRAHFSGGSLYVLFADTTLCPQKTVVPNFGDNFVKS